MKKNTNFCIDLKTVMQQDTVLVKGQAYTGVLTRDKEEHFLFEESVRQKRVRRNPKLYDGDFISLVHMQNGKYQCHMKTINASIATNRNELAFKVYCELINAFSIIND